MDFKIKSKDIEITQHLTNLQACKKYINSMEKKWIIINYKNL